MITGLNSAILVMNVIFISRDCIFCVFENMEMMSFYCDFFKNIMKTDRWDIEHLQYHKLYIFLHLRMDIILKLSARNIQFTRIKI